MARKQWLHFEDNGQDFLWWEVDALGAVTDCGPFQAWMWTQYEVHPDTIAVGRAPQIRKRGEINNGFVLKHKVERISRRMPAKVRRFKQAA